MGSDSSWLAVADHTGYKWIECLVESDATAGFANCIDVQVVLVSKRYEVESRPYDVQVRHLRVYALLDAIQRIIQYDGLQLHKQVNLLVGSGASHDRRAIPSCAL